MPRKIYLALFALILAAFACNLPQATPVPTQVVIVTATPLPATNTPSASPTPSPTLIPTSTFTPTATPIPCNQAVFIKDVTYPDNTQITVNQNFTKTWRIKNTGSCSWTSGYQLVFDSGDRMGGPTNQTLTSGSIAPGQTVDISVNLTAPPAPGTYRGNWKIREPGGTLFGVSTGAFWVQIIAVAQAPTLPGWPTLKLNDTGTNVSALQYLLHVHGQSLNVDGIFGNATQSAVMSFQGSVGLNQDGIVGANTWSALIAGTQLSQGASGDGVRAVQTLLNEKFGYTTLVIDGSFGPATTNALRDFQGNYGLNVDGIVGPDTWQMLIGS